MRLKQRLDDLTHGGVLGPVAAHVHVIEFQNRGVPCTHRPHWMEGWHMPTPEPYDTTVVGALIPDPRTEPERHDLVVEHTLHNSRGIMSQASHLASQQVFLQMVVYSLVGYSK
jgi:hypothetical protein